MDLLVALIVDTIDGALAICMTTIWISSILIIDVVLVNVLKLCAIIYQKW